MSSRAFLLSVAMLCVSVLSHAQTLSPFQILRTNQSAKSAALGGAVVSLTNDASVAMFNPALLSTVPNKRLSATFEKNLLDINAGMATYVGRVGDSNGVWAANVNFTNFGTNNKVDVNGVATGGTFPVNSVSLQGMYSNEFDSNFTYGVGLGFIQTTIDDGSSSALFLNVGLLYQMPKARTNIGFSVLNLGTQLSSFNGTKEPLPLDVRLGVNHRLRGLPLLMNFSFKRLGEDNIEMLDRLANFSIGGEIYLGKVLDVRVGFDNSVRRASSFDTQARLAGFNAGVGIKVKDIVIDYAMSTLVSSAMQHRFSLSLGL